MVWFSLADGNDQMLANEQFLTLLAVGTVVCLPSHQVETDARLKHFSRHF